LPALLASSRFFGVKASGAIGDGEGEGTDAAGEGQTADDEEQMMLLALLALWDPSPLLGRLRRMLRSFKKLP